MAAWLPLRLVVTHATPLSCRVIAHSCKLLIRRTYTLQCLQLFKFFGNLRELRLTRTGKNPFYRRMYARREVTGKILQPLTALTRLDAQATWCNHVSWVQADTLPDRDCSPAWLHIIAEHVTALQHLDLANRHAGEQSRSGISRAPHPV